MTSLNQVKVVNRVVDSWDIRISRNLEPSDWLLERAVIWREHFDAWRANPKNVGDLIEEIPELGTFTVRPGGSPYEFSLSNPEICEIRIWKPNKWHGAVGGATGQFYIAFRSIFLQFQGTDAALKFTENIVRLMCGEPMMIGEKAPVNAEFTRVSKIDLAVDTQETRDLTLSDLDHFACRSRSRKFMSDPFMDALERELKRSSREAMNGKKQHHPLVDNKGGDRCIKTIAKQSGVSSEAVQNIMSLTLNAAGVDPNQGGVSWVAANGSGNMQTVYFGSFQSPLYCRVYNKASSIDVQGKAYMRDVWTANGWDGESPVWRTEFSLTGDFLKALEIDGAAHDLRDVGMTLAAIPHVWAYLTKDWLRQCNPSQDKTKTRWETSDRWAAIQNAWSPAFAVKRAKLEPKLDLKQAWAQLKGIGTSILAKLKSPRHARAQITNLETGEQEFDPLAQFMTECAVHWSSPDGLQKIDERCKKFGLDALSDTVISREVRREQMLWGFGS
jgi:hypothetical protein